MYLPNGGNAIIDLAKLRDYCLNPLHSEGRHKARVFAAALGIGRNDAEWLRIEILKAIQHFPIVHSESMPFGKRYTVDIIVQRNGLQANVRTGWIVRAGEDFARLTTCFVI